MLKIILLQLSVFFGLIEISRYLSSNKNQPYVKEQLKFFKFFITNTNFTLNNCFNQYCSIYQQQDPLKKD